MSTQCTSWMIHAYCMQIMTLGMQAHTCGCLFAWSNAPTRWVICQNTSNNTIFFVIITWWFPRTAGCKWGMHGSCSLFTTVLASGHTTFPMWLKCHHVVCIWYGCGASWLNQDQPGERFPHFDSESSSHDSTTAQDDLHVHVQPCDTCAHQSGSGSLTRTRNGLTSSIWLVPAVTGTSTSLCVESTLTVLHGSHQYVVHGSQHCYSACSTTLTSNSNNDSIILVMMTNGAGAGWVQDLLTPALIQPLTYFVNTSPSSRCTGHLPATIGPRPHGICRVWCRHPAG